MIIIEKLLEKYSLFHLNYDKLLQTFINKYFFLINPNIITLLSLFIFIPIYFFNNIFIRGFLCLFHDFLDRLDGSMARVYIYKGIIRDSITGAYLDAICDKIYVILILNYIINDSFLLKMKVIIHLTSIIVRTLLYFSKYNIRNKSTMNGKCGTFLENTSLFLYFVYPILYPFFMTLSIIFSIKSLLDKLF
jgi:phosphatidylglycerophosphate synthase